ncbi:hypothetical protein BO70DRAFT_294261 [Aspergillus heteromorphus CBS 117.55]|uniref:Pheromone-regulated membrane protein n=1 Tax=Aspergillus heteromorphus CBS 117.55 TaxID=1448321 RepID=A0A317VYD9_9EURO|nr:uncharacterized protein BO70DRAFT_294261 [Aspergillus heteromorphus CBS 117.55]PWY78351.1 hypothetical protein BO70DRAFT_294261 [Aspergillus heteromorphus CBS 117.55]
MPCCGGDREKGPVALEEQWDYINLDDFKSESCFAPFSYFLVYVFLIISVAVYGVDTFTAVNLLIYARWEGQIEPAIPFSISRWIFAVCIIISFALLFYRWLRAIRAMRSGSIAKSYLDSLAVRIQSIRMGSRGRGWRRFLVFAELTKSKKGAEYIALFAYFSFESWMSIIFADGPRQVVNAITLYSVMQLDLLPGGKDTTDTSGSGVSQFFNNLKILAEDNTERVVVLAGMLFTLVIWVLSMLKLFLAVVLYLIFLFHHIPSEDGSLKAYCKRKINTRLTRIVRKKVNKALFKGVALQDRKPTNPNFGLDKRPTLPALGAMDDDKTPVVTTISRSTTQTTLPAYSSRPGTAARDNKPTLPDVAAFNDKPPPLSRTMTESSAYDDAASISGSTAVSAFSPLDRYGTPAPPVPPLPSQGPAPMPRSQTPRMRPNYNQPPDGYNGPMDRASPAPSMPRTQTPMSRSEFTPTPGPVPRLQTPVSRQGFTPAPAAAFSPNFATAPGYGPVDRASPAPQVPHVQTPMSYTPAPGYGPVDRASPAPQAPRTQTPMTRSNYTPALGYGPDRATPVSYATPFRPYSPAVDPNSQGLASGTPFRPYSPAVGPNSRALNHGLDFNQGVDRTLSPSQSAGLPYPVEPDEYHSASTGAMRSPLAAVPASSSMERTLSPLGSGDSGGYVAFSPAVGSSSMPFAESAPREEHAEYNGRVESVASDMESPFTHETTAETGYHAFDPSALSAEFGHDHDHSHLDLIDDYAARQSYLSLGPSQAENGYLAVNPPSTSPFSAEFGHESPSHEHDHEHEEESHVDPTEDFTARNSVISHGSEHHDGSNSSDDEPSTDPHSIQSATEPRSHEPSIEPHDEQYAIDSADTSTNPFSDITHEASNDAYIAPTPSNGTSTESAILPSTEPDHHDSEQPDPTRPLSLSLHPISPAETNTSYIAFNPFIRSPVSPPAEQEQEHESPATPAEDPFSSPADAEDTPQPQPPTSTSTSTPTSYIAFTPSAVSPATPTAASHDQLQQPSETQSPAQSSSPQARTFSPVQPYRPDHGYDYGQF